MLYYFIIFQGIIASRTHSLRELRQNLFQPKVLYLCYTLLNRVGHLMLLDCWQRWKVQYNLPIFLYLYLFLYFNLILII